MHVVEYIPHSVLGNWADYMPDHVQKMTSGADPVNMAFLRSKPSECEDLLDVAKARYPEFANAQSDSEEDEDNDSEYDPDEQSSTDEESDMDSDVSN